MLLTQYQTSNLYHPIQTTLTHWLASPSIDITLFLVVKPKEPRQLQLIEINTLAPTAVAREFANETMAYFCLQSTLDKTAKYFLFFSG
jgi:hypothetical protein